MYAAKSCRIADMPKHVHQFPMTSQQKSCFSMTVLAAFVANQDWPSKFTTLTKTRQINAIPNLPCSV